MKKTVGVILLVCIITTGLGLAEIHILSESPSLNEALVEATLISAEKFELILHEDTYLERQIPPSIWSSEAIATMQAVDYSKPSGALIIVWNEGPYSFEHFYGSRGVDLSQGILDALQTKLFSTPIDLFPFQGSEWGTLCQILAMADVAKIEGLNGIATVILVYGEDNPILVSAYGSVGDPIAMSKTTIAYINGSDIAILVYLDLCSTYFGSEFDVQNVTFPYEEDNA